MKKILLTLSIASIAALGMMAKGDNDPVLMTVNNKPVKISEFEYLYQKNNTQQSAVQPVDEYLDMFVTYKLKVADAEANGLDKTEAFANEFEGYRRDLSEPYLKDESARDSIVRLIYDRLGEEVQASHIMIPLGKTPSEDARQIATLDSIRDLILAGKADFGEMADKYSTDPTAKRNHGLQGYVTAGTFPYTFEDAVYQTPVGQISEVVRTPFGFHIVKVSDRRKNRGMVRVQHVLKLTQGLSPEEQAVKKQQIDSLYTLLAAGANFDSIAMKESEDPGSARRGGNIDFFGTGRMVPEFEETSFALKDGEISKPFQTSYGWHIVKRLEGKGVEPFEELAPRIADFISRDERQQIPVIARQNQLRKKYNVTYNDNLIAEINAEIAAAGVLDSALIAKYSGDNRQIMTMADKNHCATVAQIFEVLPQNATGLTPDMASGLISQRLDEISAQCVTEAERDNLEAVNADYRNLLNEYRDGMLLFEISDRNVWSKSKNDSEGLNEYFQAHKADYATWEKPKFKGYVVFATSDSVLNLAKSYIEANKIAGADLSESLRKEFGKNIKVERVLASKGDNKIIDGIAFGGERPEPTGKWVAYFPVEGKVIDQPEEPADERGRVTTDYQNDLEKTWVEKLHKQYKVKVNKKVLKKFKESLEK